MRTFSVELEKSRSGYYIIARNAISKLPIACSHAAGLKAIVENMKNTIVRGVKAKLLRDKELKEYHENR